MNHEKVKSVVFDILENCDCEDARVCDNCPFVKLCVGIFTGDWSDIPQPNEGKGE